MKPSEDLPEFIGNTENLVNALRHITNIKSNNVTTRLVVKAAADLIEGLIPRPIEEIDEIDGVGLCIYGDDTIIIYGAMMKGINSERLHFEPLSAIKDDGTDFDGDDYTHFIPLTAIQKLMENGE